MSVDLTKSFDPKTQALWQAISRGKRWGNAFYDVEMESRKHETAAQRRERLAQEEADRRNLEKLRQEAKKLEEAAKKKQAEADEAEAKRKNAIKKKSRHVDKVSGELKKIAKMCKWQCEGEQCWAHNQKVCPYIHRGEPGWNETKAVKKPKKGGASCTRRRKNRRNGTKKN